MNARIKPSPVERIELANVLRFLAIDAVEAAKSGHPGMPMGMADIAEVLWRRFLKHNPTDPQWADRDRFMLSNGHGSMLQYALLHLTGYALPMEELKRFRQLHSKTPGHPEVGVTAGVETTTGPLGQGLANAVGMALSEKLLAAHFNRPDHAIVDHRTWVFIGDGCLMEGISHEACSLAGTLGLSKLIVIYDDNGISIDGHVENWFTDDTPKRFEAYGWRVIRAVDGHDTGAVEAALKRACKPGDRPTLVCCKTVIGKGSPNKADTNDSSSATAAWVPPVDIHEYGDRFELYVDLPGVEPSKVDLTLEDGVLTLSGQRTEESNEGKDTDIQYRRTERSHGHFHRRFVLPDTADSQGVNATGKNGVLTVTIAKHPKALPRRIQISG